MTTVTGSSNPWMFVGLKSAFPNIDPESTAKTKLTYTPSVLEDEDNLPRPCQILEASSSENPTCLTSKTLDEAQSTLGLKPQVLVFRYRNRFHAVDHACPHSSYPLARGSVYDIEDFGIILSAGITCPKHGWAFDLHTGKSDRGSYRLGLTRCEWEVELRKSADAEEEEEERVWVRRKMRKRIG